jgi:hypothetical protein
VDHQAGLEKAAALVVDLYGESAVEYAAERVTLLEEQGDTLGAAAWRRVLPVIQSILRERTVLEESDQPLRQ